MIGNIRPAAPAGLIISAVAILAGCAAAGTPPAASTPPGTGLAPPPPTSAGGRPDITGPVATSTVPASPVVAVIDPGDVESEEPLEAIWQATDPDADAIPFHPALDPDGRIWAPITGQNRFAIFDADGTFIETWGEEGSGEGQFNFVSPWSSAHAGIAFAPDGSFYVSESGNRRVQKFNSQREFVTSWGSFGSGDDQFLIPDAIAVDGRGNVYVHDDELAVSKVFTSDGEFVRTVAQGSSPFVSVSPDGHVFAQMFPQNVLNEYGPEGTLLRSIDLDGLAALPRVSDVKVDEDGRLWVASVAEDGPRDVPDKLFVLDDEGKLIHRYDGMAVTQFALDPNGGRLYGVFWGANELSAYAIADD